MDTTERIKTAQVYLNLILSIGSFISVIVIPVYTYLVPPAPFTTNYQIVQVVLPNSFLTNFKSNRGVTQNFDLFGKNTTQVMILTVRNDGATSRHNLSIRISYISKFLEIGAVSQPAYILSNGSWKDPVFSKDQERLEVSPISELPVNGSIYLSVWGAFSDVFRDVRVSSAEGMSQIQEGTATFGWTRLMVSNLWWIITLIFLALGIVFLRRFESRRK